METKPEWQDHTLSWEENGKALCVCMCVYVCVWQISLIWWYASTVCVCANASMHVCDLSLIIWCRMLKLLLSPALFLQRPWYHLSYLNIPTVNTSGSPRSTVTHQVSSRLILTALDRDKGVLPALNGFVVLVIITGVSEEMDQLTAKLLLSTSRCTKMWIGKVDSAWGYPPWPLASIPFNLSLLIFHKMPSC